MMIHDLNKKFTFIKKKIKDLNLEKTDSNDDQFEVNLFYEPCSCFFDKIKKCNSLKNFPLLEQTLDFKFTFFEKLSQIRLENKLNLSLNELRAISLYKKEKPFVVAECDKNIGIAIVPNQIYNSLVISHLSNTSIYLPLLNDPLESTSLNIKESLELLLFNKN